MSRKSKLASISCALALGLGATTSAQAAEPQIRLIAHPAEQFQRSIDTQKLELRYRQLSRSAQDLKVRTDEDLLADADTTSRQCATGSPGSASGSPRPRRPPRASRTTASPAASRSRRSTRSRPASPAATRRAVDSSGTYFGKYQFDTGTWASVGGSGSPADASEAEQDYRASLLYSRAGSSPWPVCGV